MNRRPLVIPPSIDSDAIRTGVEGWRRAKQILREQRTSPVCGGCGGGKPSEATLCQACRRLLKPETRAAIAELMEEPYLLAFATAVDELREKAQQRLAVAPKVRGTVQRRRAS